jgi:hypothetical protein
VGYSFQFGIENTHPVLLKHHTHTGLVCICHTRWLSADAIKLCAIGEQFPCQYSHSLPEYSRKDAGDQAWKEMSEAG